MIFYFLSHPDMKANIYYVTHDVVCKTNYCRAFYILAVSYTKTNSAEKHETFKTLAPDSDCRSKLNIPIKTIMDTSKLRPEVCNITSAFCNAAISLIRL